MKNRCLKLGWAVVPLFLIQFGCAGGTGLQDKRLSENGQLRLALEAETNGKTYRLRNATVVLDGDTEYELSTSANPLDGVTDLEEDVDVGEYTVRLRSGWILYRLDDTMTATPVEARLVSIDPNPITVEEGETSRVLLRFECDGQVVGMGTVNVDIEVGCANGECPDSGNGNGNGTDVPFITQQFQSTKYARPGDTIELKAHAKDPNGSRMTAEWLYPSVGTLRTNGKVVNGDGMVSAYWVLPRCWAGGDMGTKPGVRVRCEHGSTSAGAHFDVDIRRNCETWCLDENTCAP